MASDSEDVYCTLLMSDSYLPGVSVLAHSLRDAGTRKKLAILVILDALSPESISKVKELYDYVIPVDRIRSPKIDSLFLMGRPDLSSTFTKIELWRQLNFRKIVYLDADMVSIRAPDELFDIDASFAAAPDVGWPDAFNTGVMVITPNIDDYWALRALATKGESFDGADQGLLNQYFENRNWHRISFKYNCTPNVSYQYEPAYRHYKDKISMVHFIGMDKPWSDSSCSLSNHGVYNELLGKWHEINNAHEKPPKKSAYEEINTWSSPSQISQIVKLRTTPELKIRPEQNGKDKSWSDTSGSLNNRGVYNELLSKQHEIKEAYEKPHKTSIYKEIDSWSFPSQTEKLPTTPELKIGPEQRFTSKQESEPSVPLAEEPFYENKEMKSSTYTSLPEIHTKEEPMIEDKEYSAPQADWDATRFAPPPSSKPEAPKFPTQTYKFSEDWQLFRAPESYPEPPKMWYQVPESKTSPGDRLKPIFPWEMREDHPKPTRVFLEDLPTSLPEPVAQSTSIVENIEASYSSKEAPLNAPGEQERKPDQQTFPSFHESPNVWDSMPEINQYIRSMGPEKMRLKVKDLPQHGNFDDSASHSGESLSLTPAPIRRGFWGEEGGDSSELPVAEGVPEQLDWVCPVCGFASYSSESFHRPRSSPIKSPIRSPSKPLPRPRESPSSSSRSVSTMSDVWVVPASPPSRISRYLDTRAPPGSLTAESDLIYPRPPNLNRMQESIGDAVPNGICRDNPDHHDIANAVAMVDGKNSTEVIQYQ